MTNPFKYIGGPFLLLGSLIARLFQPRRMNRLGLDPLPDGRCPKDGKPCFLGTGRRCTARTAEEWRGCHVLAKGEQVVLDWRGRVR